jgi:hypothetical protein
MMDFAPTDLKEIRRKVLAYHEKMNAIAKFLEENNAPAEIRLNKSKEFMEFYIEKQDLTRLNSISSMDGFERFAVFFGLANESADGNHNSVTTCFLGVDKNYEILSQHRSGANGRGGVQGEDTWIPPRNGVAKNDLDFTLETEAAILERHLRD